MCGIYGYVSRNDKINPEMLRAMGRALAHRGPDDEGEMIQNTGAVSAGLGHKRLSIIDLSQAGKQPMANEDETLWITLNGEIYNYQELRNELEDKGHRFRSRSDTEVVVHLYEESGTRCLDKLSGMFAFAIWDSKKKSLFLARDRVGKKPLHYCATDGGIIFASEIKALLQHPGVSHDLDLKALSKYLSYEYVPAPDTIFRSIKKLEPGHYLLHENGESHCFPYWQIPIEDDPATNRSEADYTEELRELLERAVRRRLVADVPVGLFVSGGLDSGIVAAFAARARDHLQCFSVGFDEPSFDESAYSKQVAASLGIKHHLKVFDANEMLRLVPELPQILDEPLADPSILPLFLLSRFASERMKVVLSGDGGDELFAGYQTFQAHKLMTYFSALPGFIKQSIKTISSHLPVSHGYLSTDYKLKQFLKGDGASAETRFFLWRGAFGNNEKNDLLTPDIRRELAGHDAYEDVDRYIRESGLTKELERILYLAMKLYLQDNNLVTVDRASMANGLEVRCPLLDKDVVEFVCRLPMNYKLNGFTTKYLLKRSAAGMLPRNIIYRQKRGFGIPLAKWLTTELKDFMLDYLSEERIRKQGIFHYPSVKKLIDEQFAKTNDHREPLWTLLVFQTWYERYLDGSARAKANSRG
ncbi:MAG TPA: asparagine synthase (glutamine-hydrolyzing) [Candidatus Binatia bacterium]|jgi:asparagine synthase (glutamine-hydrolysing)|nr:asparagine synthase (glutamine-hydrolyzing) [Candidatus Binatia bacterium]